MREGWRRRAAPSLIAAAAVGGYLTLDVRAPHERHITIVLGDSAAALRELELSWTNPRDPASEAALTTRWTFAQGAAPRRLPAELKLPSGPWDAELTARGGAGEAVRQRTIRVTLAASSWWQNPFAERSSRRATSDDSERPIVLMLDENPP